jgi:hypothetical protein
MTNQLGPFLAANYGAAELPPNTPPGSPLWWVRRLELDLVNRQQPLVRFLDDYYEGRHRQSFDSSKFREVFGRVLTGLQDNWMPLIVNSAVERLNVQGFRFGTAEQGDQAAWDIWQRNGLDADAMIAYREAIKHGESSLLVWWDDTNDQRARITVEHPSQVIVARSQSDRRHRTAALKRWIDESDSLRATLWLPDTVHRYRLDESTGRWAELDQAGAFTNPLGVVPVIPLTNDPHMRPVGVPNGITGAPINGITSVPLDAHVGYGRSDLMDAVSTQDAINVLARHMLVASEVASFRQRWAAGLEIPVAEDGTPVEPFEHAVNRLWISEDPNTKFGEFQATDLSNFVNAIENRVQSLASRTRTPPHYLISGMGNFPSGESLKSAETSLVAKVREKQIAFSDSLEDAMRIAFEIEGDQERATDLSAETIWASPESRTETQLMDSLVKKAAIGVPQQQLWEDAGYSPQQIQRFSTMLAEQATLAGAGVFAASPADQGIAPAATTAQDAATAAPAATTPLP